MAKHIVSFSGGKDSTALLLMMLEKGMQIDEILCCDTTVEFPEMYEHIDKVQDYIKEKYNKSITIIRAEYDFEYYMFDHVKTRGKNKGSKGYGFPDFRNRWCTQALKKSIINKYLRKYKGEEVIEYHGIAYDEIDRTTKNSEKTVIYPLVEWELTEKDAIDYCYNLGFDWGGLYQDFKRLSCWCCPLKRQHELYTLYTKHRHLWDKLKEWDKRSYRKFKVKTIKDEVTGDKKTVHLRFEELEEKFEKNANKYEKQIEMLWVED